MKLIDTKYFATISDKSGSTITGVELRNFDTAQLLRKDIWVTYYCYDNACTYIGIISKQADMFDCGLYKVVSVKKVNIYEDETIIY